MYNIYNYFLCKNIKYVLTVNTKYSQLKVDNNLTEFSIFLLFYQLWIFFKIIVYWFINFTLIFTSTLTKNDQEKQYNT